MEAAVKAGAPEDIIAWIDVPSLELTNMLMQSEGLILVSGKPGMVKSAYSSGKPALGVGAGNTPAVIDESANVILAVNSIIHSKTFDNGMICASEQSVLVEKEIYKEFEDLMKKAGCYFVNPEEKEKLKNAMFEWRDDLGFKLKSHIPGQSPFNIAKQAGFDIPEDTKVIVVYEDGIGREYPFSKEKLSPVLTYYIVDNYEEASHISTGSAVKVTGKLKLTPDGKQPFEIEATHLVVEGTCDEDFPLQKKRHSFEYMREIPHLRPRANTFYAIFRLRSVLSMAIHEFFQNQGFVYVHTPIITSNDGEGAGEMFRATTIDNTEFDKDFFGKEAYLTVTGQLHV